MQTPPPSERKNLKFVLATMPFYSVHFPDLAIGKLKASLNDVAGLSASCRYLNVEFQIQISYLLYSQVAESDTTQLYSDFIMAPFLTQKWSKAHDRKYCALTEPFRGRHKNEIRSGKIHELRLNLQQFIDKTVNESSWKTVDVVILNAKYMNLLSSVFFAKRIKEVHSHLRVVIFGELISDEIQKAEYSLIFPFIDAFISSSEYKEVLDQLGLLFDLDELLKFERSEQALNIIPDYDEYFLAIDETVEPSLLIETSRGCWWYKCHFCSSRGTSRKVYQRNAVEVVDEIRKLTARYKILRYELTDVCLNPKFIGPFLAAVDGEYDFRFFAEVRSDLSTDELEQLYRAGVRTVQVGIESFSTPLLGRIEKGVTCLQNILFLRNAAEAGMAVVWNLMYGFPDETEDDYEFSIALMPALVHLPRPANLIALRGERNGQYHLSGRCGDPNPIYQLLYPGLSHDVLPKISNYFAPPPSPDSDKYAKSLGAAYTLWTEAREASLTIERGPDFLVLRDARDGRNIEVFTLTGWQSSLYLYLRQIRKFDQGIEFAAQTFGVVPGEVKSLLSYLESARLVARDGDEVLALACMCP